MSYSRTTWANGATALSAEHMNNIEDGINEALTAAQGNSDMWSYIRNLVYPVGSIYMTASLDTVAKVEAALGGTWVKWGAGRVPVGVDTSDTNFDTVEETGGSKDAIVPSHDHTATFSGTAVAGHTHTGPSHTHGLSNGSTSETGSHVHGKGTLATISNGNHKHTSKARTSTADSGSSQRSGPWTQDTTYADQSNIYTSEAGAHTHTIDGQVASAGSHFHSLVGNTSAAGTGATGSAGGHTPAGTVTVASKGESATGKNLQPYITCYMYKRTA